MVSSRRSPLCPGDNGRNVDDGDGDGDDDGDSYIGASEGRMVGSRR